MTMTINAINNTMTMLSLMSDADSTPITTRQFLQNLQLTRMKVMIVTSASPGGLTSRRLTTTDHDGPQLTTTDHDWPQLTSNAQNVRSRHAQMAVCCCVLTVLCSIYVMYQRPERYFNCKYLVLFENVFIAFNQLRCAKMTAHQSWLNDVFHIFK